MKEFLLIIFCSILLSFGAFSQSNDDAQSEFIIECSDPILRSDLYAKSIMPVFRTTGESLSAAVISNTEYPTVAKKYKNSGFVKVSFRVNTEGTVSKLKVLESSNEVFNASALKGVSNTITQFHKPAIFEGTPVTVDLAIDITFRVRGIPFGSCIHNIAYDYAMAGLEHMNKGNFNEAISFFTESIEVDTSYYEGYLDRAKAFRKTGQSSLAIKDVRTSLTRVNPERAESLALLGSIYLDIGQSDEALGYLKQALELDSKNYLALVDYGKILLGKSDFDKAKEHLKKALRQHHTPTEAWYYLGLTELAGKEYKSGGKLFSKVIESQPNYGQAFYNRGMCYARMSNMDSACEDWVTAKELGVEDAELLVESQCTGK